jgi:hypothetical protein
MYRHKQKGQYKWKRTKHLSSKPTEGSRLDVPWTISPLKNRNIHAGPRATGMGDRRRSLSLTIVLAERISLIM